MSVCFYNDSHVLNIFYIELLSGKMFERNTDQDTIMLIKRKKSVLVREKDFFYF